jgi:predicted Ser/Thr protein kinase
MDELTTSRTMTPEEFQRIREVFEGALARPVSERRMFVESACGSDTVLQDEVERMLAAAATGHVLLDGPVAPARARAGARASAGGLACPACRASVSAEHRFCPACGSPVTGETEGRFRSGALFANRFRIVAALGRGGMGEVYRAQDLELGQPVALKFLTTLRPDSQARNRLRNEVRLARQLAHPNVCRVYDIGEAHGELYLSMEYVDGEDLGALLKRIGRLPVDKGIEIARKLCAGLAAAHARGVVHRDFKPSNIMIDGHGEVRIMDFGLAAVAASLDPGDVRSGTPAYMAPEQLAGREATVQSDLYALGLVLYELFTGRAAFEAKDAAALQRQREDGRLTNPSTFVPELGERVERVILSCLEPESKLRPASALDVSAALPGGDPLAEALAAGQTPSPEMVAAAGSREALRPAVAIALVACIGVGLAAWCWLTPKVQMVSQLPFEYPPDALAAKGRDIARSLGYQSRPAETAFGFHEQAGYLEHVETVVTGTAAEKRTRWADLLGVAPSPVTFWYRESAAPLVPIDAAGLVTAIDPPLVDAGAISMDLGLDGRLMRFSATPAATDQRPAAAADDWSILFRLAQLEVGDFRPVEPRRTPQQGEQAAWEGVYPGRAGFPVRVEAARVSGQVTHFGVVFPWGSDSQPVGLQAPSALLTEILFLVAALVARHNWKAERIDGSGAWRIAFLVGASILLALVLMAHRVVDLFNGVKPAIPLAIAGAVWAATLYMACEPWVRRLWPESMITWSRVISGRWRDPLVGRDVLIGVLGAVAVSSLNRAIFFWLTYNGAAPQGTVPLGGDFGFVLDNLAGAPSAMAGVFMGVVRGLQNSVATFFVLFVFKVLLRRTWLAVAGATIATIIGPTLLLVLFTDETLTVASLFLAFLSTLLFTMAVRFGFFVLVTWVFVGQFAEHAMLTPEFGAWYGTSSLLAVVLIAALAAWGFHASLGGQQLFTSGVDRKV